jgi:undecaprenyl-diphosphatase
MVSVIEALFLGVLQGITEWLPVSSSAHLALAQHYLGIEAPVSFDVALHLGTILAVFAYYKNDLASLARGILARDAKDLRFAALLTITAIPTAAIGFAFKGVFESMFTSPPAIATALAITGVFLIIASRVAGRAEGSAQPDAKSSFIIGVAQGIAVAPGISRSGATIGTALLLGIKKEEAARFSFLAGIVPILGASLLEGRKAALGEVEFLPLALGLATAAIIGYLSIGLLLRFLRDSRLQWFGYYCLAIAGLVLASVLA